ncbi:MAG TPA: hypothetical protein EYP03_02965 [Aquificae bacterium]|nr:hypothetical protein [Aquificota bacterium]
MELNNTNNLSNKDKRKIRYNAINLLYDYQIGNLNIEETFEKFWENKEEDPTIKEYTKKLYKSVLDNLEEIDMIISKYLNQSKKYLKQHTITHSNNSDCSDIVNGINWLSD